MYYNITENSAILADIGYKFPQEILNLILNAIAPEDIINIIKHANLENISYDVLESQMGGEDSDINNSLSIFLLLVLLDNFKISKIRL
ncbi:hypothetical protein FLA4_10090 [Candidatus Rickettsia kotlanii]|nr:hypothetical protein FLA4_10090 [Candidatus Rickettsia kotlanii]BDU61842.1 hypothetical protein HM2_10100 [Candidatus Rickettsia kotlanii]